ncbi:MAG: Zn-ribbon domain-containing OB-fold protein [Gammaproteobacteria bacterium]|nr:Zn-ribbon domain-containing OB-fold protein [Gammaproteobacteria bacterium]
MNTKPIPEMSDLSRHYWEQAQREALVLQRCTRCGTYQFYPRAWCTSCFCQELEWTPVSGRAEVFSFSIVHYPPFESYTDSVPYILATVKLEEGPQMMCNLLECDLDAVRVGLPVQVCYEVREGDFKVPQFRPVGGGA